MGRWSWLRFRAAYLKMAQKFQAAIMVCPILRRQDSWVSMRSTRIAIAGFALGHQHVLASNSTSSYVSTPTYTLPSELRNSTFTCSRFQTCSITHLLCSLSLERRGSLRYQSYAKRLGYAKIYLNTPAMEAWLLDICG